MISGFLSKPQAWEIFLKKILRQLIVPLLLLGSILVFINSFRSLISGTFSFSNQLHSFEGLLCGQQQALGGLWFVYTLIVCRFIAQIENIKIKGLIALLLLIGSYFYNNYSSHPENNCWVNTLIAYPMFYIGEVSATRKNTINEFSNRLVLIILSLIGLAGVIFCGYCNGPVWMYRCLYGGNMLLFIFGSVCGTMMLYGISKLLFDRPNNIISLICDGSIVILAFHIYFVTAGLHYPIGYGYYLEAILVMILFIPIILVCKKYFPILLGYRGMKVSKSIDAKA